MTLLKKLFKKIKKKSKKEENECWYNNSHEKEKGRWSKALEGEAFDPNYFDATINNP